MIWAILDAIMLLVGVWGLIAAVFTPKGRSYVAQLLSNLTAGAFDVAGPLIDALAPVLNTLAEQFHTALTTHGPTIAADIKVGFRDLASGTLTNVTDDLKAGGESTVDNAAATASLAFSTAFGNGMASAGVAALFEAIFPEKLNTLDGLAPLLAKMAGFDEVAAAVLDPLYKNAFGRSLEYKYRALFKPEFPSEDDAVSWHARRLDNGWKLQDVFAVSGLKPQFEQAYIDGAFRPVQPRALMTAFIDTPFPHDEVKALLEFNGYRDQDIALMLEAFQANSTKNVRQQFLSAVITAAERGTLTDAEVDNALTNLNFSDEAKGWVKGTIATRKLEQLAEIYRKSISEAYKFGQITDAQYVPALEAIGIAAADANAHFAVDSIALRGHEAAAASRAAIRAANAITHAQAAAAIENFQRGNLDAAGLGAALIAAGVPAQIVPFSVDLQSLKRDARKHIVFGLVRGPEAAALLREQVAALKEQAIKKAITIDQAKLQLQSLGLPASNVDALIAAWNAQVNKTALPI